MSASETHNQKNVQPIGRRVARRRAGRRRRSRTTRASPVEAIVSTAFGCPYEGDVAPEHGSRELAGAPARRAAPTACRSATPPGMATPRRVDDLLDALDRGRDRRRPRRRCTSTTRAAPALANVLAALDAGRHAVRRVDRRSRRLSVRAGRVGQRRHRGSRAHARRHGDRHRHRSRRADRLRAPRAGASSGRELPGAVHARRTANRTYACETRRREPTPSEVARAHRARARRATSRRTREKLAAAEQAVRARSARAAARRRLVRRRRAARQRARRRSARRRCGHRRRPHRRPAGVRDGQRPDGEGRLVGRAHGREDRAAHRDTRCGTSCRSCTSSTRPARASPTRSSCSRAGAARAGSSPTRCGCRAGCRRCAACSGRRPRAARTSRRSATSVFMVEGNASMYLGSPRMAEVVIGEKVTLEEMGGARMHATVSGCGDNLVRRRRRGDRRGAALPLVPARRRGATRSAGGRGAAPVATREADRDDRARARSGAPTTCTR